MEITLSILILLWFIGCIILGYGIYEDNSIYAGLGGGMVGITFAFIILVLAGPTAFDVSPTDPLDSVAVDTILQLQNENI